MNQEKRKELYKRLREKGIDTSLVHHDNKYRIKDRIKDEISRTRNINVGKSIPPKKGYWFSL